MFNNQWGPHGWLFLHSITFQYPDNPSLIDKKNYYNFFHSLQFVLPCEKCRSHFSSNLKKYPIQLNSRLNLIHWLINIHNNVNKSLHKKNYSINQIQNLYQRNYNYDLINNKIIDQNFNHYIYIIILSILLIYYIKS